MMRRVFLAGASAALATGCMGQTATTRGAAIDPAFQPQPNASYDAWRDAFFARAQAQGIRADTLRAGFVGQGFLPGVVTRDRNQTEFRRTTED